MVLRGPAGTSEVMSRKHLYKVQKISRDIHGLTVTNEEVWATVCSSTIYCVAFVKQFHNLDLRFIVYVIATYSISVMLTLSQSTKG